MPGSRTPRRERSPRICSLRLRAYAVCARLVAPDEALHEAGPHRCAGRYFRAVSSAQPCCVSRRCFIPSFLLLSSLSLPLCCLSLSLAEFSKIAQATATGFAIMGFIGFFVKLIFIPINNIIGARAAAAAKAIQPRSPPIVFAHSLVVVLCSRHGLRWCCCRAVWRRGWIVCGEEARSRPVFMRRRERERRSPAAAFLVDEMFSTRKAKSPPQASTLARF